MPTAYILRLTDAHHVLAQVAKELSLPVPAMPGSSFNPCSSMVQSLDATRSAKAPEAWKNQAPRPFRPGFQSIFLDFR